MVGYISNICKWFLIFFYLLHDCKWKRFTIIWLNHSQNTTTVILKRGKRVQAFTFGFLDCSNHHVGSRWLLFYLRNVLKKSRKSFYGPLARHVKLPVAHAPGMPGTFFPTPWDSDSDMLHGMCVPHAPWCMPGSLTSAFPWSRWLGKRSRHSRCARNFTTCWTHYVV